MAAYAALVSLMNDLELIPNHPTHSFYFDNNLLTSLSQTVRFLVCFTERHGSRGSYDTEAAEAFEGRIASAAHAAHDVVEAHIVYQIQAGYTLPAGTIRSYLRNTIKNKAIMPFLYYLGREPRSHSLLTLPEAIEHMHLLKQEAFELMAEEPTYSTELLTSMQFKSKGELIAEQPQYLAPLSTSMEPLTSMQLKSKSQQIEEQPAYSPQSTSPEPLASKKNVMVGFGDVVDRLLNMLTGEPSDKRLAIPIVGMGGIGKTTLAKHVYENSLIKHHFDVHLWATISYEYSLETILAQLLSGITCTGANASELCEEVHKRLYGRRYLIVLDDMWSVEAWDKIHLFLPDNGNGSRVVVTTRLSNLTHCLNSPPFKMDFLDEDSSWQLFYRNAIRDHVYPVELEEIGKKIANRCKGLPLSIVVIGGHLRRSSRTVEYWEKFASYMNPISSSVEDDECLNVIRLSYDHLPACLKPCFLYMGVFKEDEQINASKLIRIWVAEGFVRANTDQTLEKVAEDYLNDLIERNLVLVGERRWNGKVETCVIHDVMRELCLKIAKKEKFLAVLGTTEAIDMERRIVIPQGRLDPDVVAPLKSAPHLHSLNRQEVRFSDELSVNFASTKLLRVSANVSNMLLKEDGICLPAAHSRQLNLRYLAFSSKKLSPTGQFKKRPHLPSSISLLWNMQTLAIDNFDVQISAPCEIWEMSQLRHLLFRGFYLADPAPLPGDRSDQQRQECIILRNLQTLIGVEDLRLTEEVCKRMPNIRELSVFYDRFPDDCNASSYYCPHNLDRFGKLESLKCEFGDDSMFNDDSKWRDVVRNFTFPTSLEELCLWNSNIHWEDLTGIIKSLPNLRSLKLNSVQGPEWDLDDQEFSRLRVLWISKCDDLVVWNADSSHFPVLEILRVWTMPNLNEIPMDIGEIPTLGLIELYHCNVSAAVSAMRLVMEQESCGNQDIQLELHLGDTEEVDSFLKTVDEEGLRISSLQLNLP